MHVCERGRCRTPHAQRQNSGAAAHEAHWDSVSMAIGAEMAEGAAPFDGDDAWPRDAGATVENERTLSQCGQINELRGLT